MDNPRTELDELEAALRECGTNTMISVHRLAPSYAKGWLDDVPTTVGGAADLLHTIRQQFGGGTFLLQWKIRRADNAVRFGSSRRTIVIAGDPLFHGRGVRFDGSTEPREATTPVVVQTPAPSVVSQQPAFEQIWQIVQPFLPKPQEGAQHDLTGIAKLIEVVHRMVNPGAAVSVDPMGELERQIEMYRRLKSVFGHEGQRADSRDDSDDVGGGGILSDRMMERMLMAKLFGGSEPQQQVQPQQAPQQQRQPPPNVPHVWNGQRWVPMTAPPPPPPPPVQQPTRAEPASTDVDDREDDSDELAPLTPDEVVDELGSMTQAEQNAWLAAFLDRVPPEIQERFASQIAAQFSSMKLDLVSGGK